MKNIYFFIHIIEIIFSYNLIKYEEIEKISLIKFNNPNDLNKFDIVFLKELNNIIDSINTQKIDVLIITGEGDKSFSIGSKPEEINKMTDLNKKEYNNLIKKIFTKIENFPIPIIAVVNGLTIREGVELAVCCDFIICSEKAIFGFNEDNEKFFYEFQKPQRLLNFIDKGIAKKIFLSKDYINSYEAYKIGLVNSYYSQNKIFEEGIKLAKMISKNSKNAIKNSKKSINEGAKIINAKPDYNEQITFLISIHFETRLDEKIYILGNISDFGNWKEKKYKMNLTNVIYGKQNILWKKVVHVFNINLFVFLNI